LKKSDIKEYSTLDASTLYIISQWLDKYEPNTVKNKVKIALNVATYLEEQHYEEVIKEMKG
tara:strand:+ start:3564 stop:3746 length:183 start_codon:yes stop_codon:yes gene_type:complete